MDSRKRIKLTNNLRTIIFIVFVVSAVCYFVLYALQLQPPTTLNFAIGLILFPITSMFKTREFLKAAPEMKDISTDEIHRLRYISKRRAASILKVMVFYLSSAMALIIFFLANAGTPSTLRLATSLVFGLLITGVYSFWVASIESDEVSDFRSKVQARTNQKAQQDAFSKKIAEASKSKA